MPDAVVIGAGLGGLGAAVALQRAGWEVSVFEKAPELAREAGSISLWPNGMAALAALGVRPSRAEVVDRMTLRDGRGRTLVDVDLARMARRYGHPSVTLWRQDLLDDLAQSFGGPVQLGRRCVGVQTRTRSAVASFADGTTAEADLVVGADGVASAVRHALWGGRARYAGTTCWEGRLRRPVAATPADTVLGVADGATFGAAGSPTVRPTGSRTAPNIWARRSSAWRPSAPPVAPGPTPSRPCWRRLPLRTSSPPRSS
jgi:FAD-dependent urate hydroxylase